MESGEEGAKDEGTWLPPREADDVLEPPGHPLVRKPMAEPGYEHPLLAPLARAQDGIARLEARAEAASPAVVEGLRARMAYREAAGWLAYGKVWIHPQDLALRDAGLTGSYAVAAMAGRLAAELPATSAPGSEIDLRPSDAAAGAALRLARAWRRLAEHRTWAPLADAGAMRETLRSLGAGGPFTGAEIDEWLASLHARDRALALIRAGRAARDWINRSAEADPLGLDGMFLAACVWQQNGFGRAIALPFWTAPAQRHYRLALWSGLRWMAGFLDCVAAAAKVARDELVRLEEAEGKGRTLARTTRSRLPQALEAIVGAPIVTARGLANTLDITPQAALGLLRQLTEAGIVREATGRSSWRAFVLA